MQVTLRQTEHATVSVLEIISGISIFVGAVLASFIWIPLVAIVTLFTAAAAGFAWLFRRVWSWYDESYPGERDPRDRPTPYVRPLSGLRRDDALSTPPSLDDQGRSDVPSFWPEHLRRQLKSS